MPLTDAAVRGAKPGSKMARMFDEHGLYLDVSPSGGKWPRFKYRFEGKEKRLSLGVYPDVSLKDARERWDSARKLLTNGVDPGGERKAQKLSRAGETANNFELAARGMVCQAFAQLGTHPIDAFQGTFVVQCALRLAPLFFAQPGELRQAKWDQFDLPRAGQSEDQPRWDLPCVSLLQIRGPLPVAALPHVC